jgi:hypothetical protein
MTISPLDFLRELGVKLSPSGADRYRCACPVHGGDGPSMAIALHKNRWQLTCFACGFNGGTIDLVKEIRKCSTGDAFRLLSVPERLCLTEPRNMHRREAAIVACERNGCGAFEVVEAKTYKIPGKTGSLWESSIIDEVMHLANRGWEISAGAEFFLCPPCVDASTMQVAA